MSDSLRILVLGAHPDDGEYKCGGSAVRWARAGHAVRFVSVTDGRSGHHRIPPDALVNQRTAEAAAAARLLGIESEILPFPDGSLEPSLEVRQAIIRLERRWRPDVVLTHRPNDYHPDHRYTSQVVQDAAYMVMVPHVCPDTAVLTKNPAIFYLSDDFARPYPFSPDAFVRIDDAFDLKIEAMACHQSQFFEWLPHIEGRNDLPLDPVGRLGWLAAQMKDHDGRWGRRWLEAVAGAGPASPGEEPPLVEAFETCEYGGRLSPAAFAALFPESAAAR